VDRCEEAREPLREREEREPGARRRKEGRKGVRKEGRKEGRKERRKGEARTSLCGRAQERDRGSISGVRLCRSGFEARAGGVRRQRERKEEARSVGETRTER